LGGGAFRPGRFPADPRSAGTCDSLPKDPARYSLPEEDIVRFLQLIGSGAIIVETKVEIAVVERDRSDNGYLKCAVEGGAPYMVSGDQHLLELEEFEGIANLTAAGFLAVVSFASTFPALAQNNIRSARILDKLILLELVGAIAAL
jgi:hypothetical protein